MILKLPLLENVLNLFDQKETNNENLMIALDEEGDFYKFMRSYFHEIEIQEESIEKAEMIAFRTLVIKYFSIDEIKKSEGFRLQEIKYSVFGLDSRKIIFELNNIGDPILKFSKIREFILFNLSYLYLLFTDFNNFIGLVYSSSSESFGRIKEKDEQEVIALIGTSLDGVDISKVELAEEHWENLELTKRVLSLENKTIKTKSIEKEIKPELNLRLAKHIELYESAISKFYDSINIELKNTRIKKKIFCDDLEDLKMIILNLNMTKKVQYHVDNITFSNFFSIILPFYNHDFKLEILKKEIFKNTKDTAFTKNLYKNSKKKNSKFKDCLQEFESEIKKIKI